MIKRRAAETWRFRWSFTLTDSAIGLFFIAAVLLLLLGCSLHTPLFSLSVGMVDISSKAKGDGRLESQTLIPPFTNVGPDMAELHYRWEVRNTSDTLDIQTIDVGRMTEAIDTTPAIEAVKALERLAGQAAP